MYVANADEKSGGQKFSGYYNNIGQKFSTQSLKNFVLG